MVKSLSFGYIATEATKAKEQQREGIVTKILN